MKNLKYLFLLILLSSTMFTCKKESYKIPEGLLLGMSFETEPGFNLTHFSASDAYTFLRTSEEFFDGNYSLKIESTSKNDLNFGFWKLQVSDFEKDKSLTLKLRVKASNLEGMGFNIIMIAVDESLREPFAYIANIDKLVTNNEWEAQEISFDKVLTDEVDYVNIFMLLESRTIGEVFFDKLELISK